MRNRLSAKTPASISERMKEKSMQTATSNQMTRRESMADGSPRSFHEQLLYPAFIGGLHGQPQSTKHERFPGSGDDLGQADCQPADGFDIGYIAQRRVFTPEIVEPKISADAPAIRRKLLHDERFGFNFAADFADDLFENVLDSDDAGRAAELIHNDGEAALLPLETLEQLEQV